MGANPVGQTMEHWRNVELAFQHAKSAFAIGEGFIAINDAIGREVLHVGHDNELTVNRVRRAPWIRASN
ncbi:MAG: hypothetical protein ACRESZ_21865 [Methylococcales bacterium]